MDQLDLFISLGLSLALGLLVGLQREWQAQRQETEIIAGLRTFGLVGLLGGLSAVVAIEVGNLVIALAFAALILLTAVGYFRDSSGGEGIGLTTEIALIATFVVGLGPVVGYRSESAAVAVIVTLLLSLKPRLHGLVEELEREELFAALKLLLISVVLLPILPNEGYGPYDGVLNPYEIWWMVVLIAGISFVGYFAMKIGGRRHGAVLTGLFGGLASSTATTLSLSRYARDEEGAVEPLAAGILASCGTMFPRIVVLAFAVDASFGRTLLVPFLTMAALTYVAAALFWWRSREDDSGGELDLQNPFQLMMALKFGLLLVVILLLGKALSNWLEAAGVYLLAAASGIADVDAITLSVSRMIGGEITPEIALTAVLIAAGVNSLVKSGMAMSIGGSRLGLRVGIPMLVALAGGFLLRFLL